MKSDRIHAEVLTPTQVRLLSAASAPAGEWGAYLAGGSAAALYLGHRRSDDFDWFAPKATPPSKLLDGIRRIGRDVKVLQNDEGTFNGSVDGVKFSVFRYPYPLLNAPTSYNGCELASLEDLVAMKLVAVTQRTTKRDYVDIYTLMKTGAMSLEAQIVAFQRKYPKGDPTAVVRALGYYGDVDKEAMPVMLDGTTWDDVKRGLTRAFERFDLKRALELGRRGGTLDRGPSR